MNDKRTASSVVASANRQAKKERDESRAEKETTYLLAREGFLQKRKEDTDLVHYIVNHSAATDAQRKTAESALEWLTRNETRCLHHLIRCDIRRIEQVLRLVDKGKISPDQETRLAWVKANKRLAPKRIKRQINAKLPDWFNDKTLLPLKPPVSGEKTSSPVLDGETHVVAAKLTIPTV